MYTTVRYWFKYGYEEDEVMITEKEFSTLEKAKAYCYRYAKGPKFASVEIQDESGNVIFELYADGAVYDYTETNESECKKMLDYVVKKEELPKGITLRDYVIAKGLTEDNWLLIKDYHRGKLLTGVRADSLTVSEKDYYVVIVENYIFPQYTEHSERPYYIVVYISKTPVDFIPVVHTSVEVEKVEAPEENTSGPEQPAEEDEEQENPEQTPADENNQGVELTSLERAVFEAFKDSSDLEHEYIFKSLEFGSLNNEEEEKYYLNLASNESSKSYVFKYLISKAGLQETYQAWLAERKKHEALEAKNI